MNPEVDQYLAEAEKWKEELAALRSILLDCDLDEELKWRSPCYCYKKHNVAIIGELKDCCTLSFFKGTLLKDPRGILQKPGENTRAGRVIRFTGVEEIEALAPVLKEYLKEAVELEKAGRKVDFDQDRDIEIPEEFQSKLDEEPGLKTAFEALTPGRQRAYLLFFSGAKQSKTRTSRVEKYIPRILDGKGINDCTCGLSRKMPYCDGSHNELKD